MMKNGNSSQAALSVSKRRNFKADLCRLRSSLLIMVKRVDNPCEEIVSCYAAISASRPLRRTRVPEEVSPMSLKSRPVTFSKSSSGI